MRLWNSSLVHFQEKREALLPAALPVPRMGAGAGGRAGGSVGATALQPPARKENRCGFFPCSFLDMEATLVKRFLVPLALTTRAKYS